MKALSKIAILIGFIVSVSSCQKEDSLSPQGCSSQENSSNQRVADPSGAQDNSDPSTVVFERGDENTEDEVIGGGDDDRDGGGKKIKND